MAQSKTLFELIYDQLKFESKNLKEFHAQKKKFELSIEAMKIVRKEFAKTLKSLKEQEKHATGAEARAIYAARRQIIENDYAIFDGIEETRGYITMMERNRESLEQLVKDYGREAKALYKEGE